MCFCLKSDKFIFFRVKFHNIHPNACKKLTPFISNSKSILKMCCFILLCLLTRFLIKFSLTYHLIIAVYKRIQTLSLFIVHRKAFVLCGQMKTVWKWITSYEIIRQHQARNVFLIFQVCFVFFFWFWFLVNVQFMINYTISRIYYHVLPIAFRNV